MSISAIDNSNTTVSSIQYTSVSPVNNGKQNSDGNDGSAVSAAAQGGRFASVIEQTLTQLGASDATTNSSDASSASSTQDAQQATQAFMHQLFTALHAQNGGQNTASTADSGNANGTVTGAGGHYHHHGGGRGKLEGGLQNLVQQLSSTAGTNTSDTGTTGQGSTNSSLNDLQQSFTQMLSADGLSGSNVTLSSFLQTLSQNLQGAPSTGNVVSTKA